MMVPYSLCHRITTLTILLNMVTASIATAPANSESLSAVFSRDSFLSAKTSRTKALKEQHSMTIDSSHNHLLNKRIPWTIARGGSTTPEDVVVTDDAINVTAVQEEEQEQEQSLEDRLKVNSVADNEPDVEETTPSDADAADTQDDDRDSQDIKTSSDDDDHDETKPDSAEDEKEVEEEKKEKDSSLIFAATSPGDGHETDEDQIPTRFLKMQKGNREKAKAAFIATVAWREKHNINAILSLPHPKFDMCKTIFPVYIPGRDMNGNLIIVQPLGKIDFDLAKKNNVTGHAICMYYVYICEYCWHILAPGPPDQSMTTVVDFDGVKFSTFRNSEIRNFCISFVRMMSDHYPQRSFKTMVINSPGWFELAYKLVRPLLRESTKAKIFIMKKGPAQDKYLLDIIGKNAIPLEVLHDTDIVNGRVLENGVEPGKDSSYEKDLRAFCMSKIEEAGETMQAFV